MSILGIEIGGTKLQLGIGDGRRPELDAVIRHHVDRPRGAEGILDNIEGALAGFAASRIEAIGVGFGGPVDSANGRVRLSHHVEGWEDFPLGEWLQRRMKLPVTVVNDCDAAALGEVSWGAGRGRKSMFYVTVGTGIGGGYVVDGELQGRGRPSVAEIGHMRLRNSSGPTDIVESHASGTGIANQARLALEAGETPSSLRKLGKPVEQLTSVDVAHAAVAGDRFAQQQLAAAASTLGWAIGQVVTLLAPEAVVLGGGVSEIEHEHFFDIVESAAREQAFPPLRDSFELLPAELGDEVVIHGAIAATQLK